MSVLRCPLGHMVEPARSDEDLDNRVRFCIYCGCHYEFPIEEIKGAEA